MSKELYSPKEAFAIYRPEVITCSTQKEVDYCAAEKVIGQIAAKPNSVLFLPTGETPKGLYKWLVRAYEQYRIDCKELTIFNVDEYWPIKSDHPASYARYMRENLIKQVNIDENNWHIPYGEAPDVLQEAARYEQLLKESGGVDLAILGIGPKKTCHIGFNERGSSIDSRTRYMLLADETRDANKKNFTDQTEMPDGAITLGIANILESEKILLIAKGVGKAWGIDRTLHGPIGPDAPSTYLRYHPNVTIVIDKEASQLLPGLTQ